MSTIPVFNFVAMFYNFFYLDTPRGCEDCKIPLMDKIGRPEPTAFSYYLPFFLQDNPSADCAKGGHAAYGQVRFFYFMHSGVIKIDLSN